MQVDTRWPALKAVMAANGYSMGDSDPDTLIAANYGGETDEETLVMADLFRSEYLRTKIIYTNRFVLDDSGELWTLYDPDMESRGG